MPIRTIPLITGNIYHVYNTSVNGKVFEGPDFARALRTLAYYQFTDPGMKLSRLLKKPDESQSDYIQSISSGAKHVDIIAYSLLDDHYHLLLLQNIDPGISNFISNFTNSYTRYFNNRHEGKGAIFTNQFKAVLIENMEKLLEVSRFIHAEPALAGKVNEDSLTEYPYSSLWEYENLDSIGLCFKKPILDQYDNLVEYLEFVKNIEEIDAKKDNLKNLLFHG